MYGLTRGTTTLLGAAVAALLLWLGVQVIQPLDEGGGPSAGEYWTFMGLLAAAGFVIALSQLLGGWTKWGWPRVSLGVFLLGFLPAAVVALWLLAFHQPGDNELAERVRDWSDDLGLDGALGELGLVASVAAFGTGLLFGLTFDTTGPRTRATAVDEPADAPTMVGGRYRRPYADEDRVRREEQVVGDATPARDDEQARTWSQGTDPDDAPPPPREPR